MKDSGISVEKVLGWVQQKSRVLHREESFEVDSLEILKPWKWPRGWIILYGGHVRCSRIPVSIGWV